MLGAGRLSTRVTTTAATTLVAAGALHRAATVARSGVSTELAANGTTLTADVANTALQRHGAAVAGGGGAEQSDPQRSCGANGWGDADQLEPRRSTL